MLPDVVIYVIYGLVATLWVVGCFVVASVWEEKGLSRGEGFAISFFLSPLIGVLIGILEALGSSESGSKNRLGSRICPQCGEYVKLGASICRFCGHKFEVNYLELAEEYEEKEMLPEAISMYEQYLKINPNDPDACNNLGLLYDEEENYKKAIATYKKAIGIKPDYEIVYYNLGSAYESLGESKRAIESYEQYKKLNPKADDIPEIEEKIQLLRKNFKGEQ